MRSQWKRLAWAALLSCACFAATLLWYKSTERDLSIHTGEAPLAQVGRVGDEVLKKPPTRLLWQSVNTGDYLYNNESIRTSSRGEIRIQFEDGRYIDLEPDSLVVLQKSQGEIALDLMEGSVFVNAKNTEGSDAPQLVLNSAGAKVDLSGASAALTKGKGSSVDLQVLEGRATIKDKDGKSKEISEGGTLTSNDLKIEIISPSIKGPVYIDPDMNESMTFKWKGFPPQYNIVLMGGPNRKELKQWAATSQPGQTELKSKIPLGKNFWKLVAQDPTTQEVKGESSIYRSEFVARFAPTMIFPAVDADLPVEKFPATLTFKWQKGEDASRVVLEVASDRSLKNKIANKNFTDEESFDLQNVNAGEYYWRLSAFYPDSNKPITGKIQRFTVSKLQKKDPVRLSWILPEEKKHQFFVEKPQLEVSWKPENREDEIAGFRFIVTEEDGSPEEALKFRSKNPQAKIPVTKPGRYIASIEAVDKEGSVIGRSDPQTLMATVMPLLTAPKILPEEGVIRSQLDGRTEITWESLDGAKEYQLIVTNKEGKELANKRYQKQSTQLKNLLPGEYLIKVIAIDEFGRMGQEGPARTLVVPDRSNIQAPKLKKIKVN